MGAAADARRVAVATSCRAVTSAPAWIRELAAAVSVGGSYHVLVTVALTIAFGFAICTPSANPLMPATTDGMVWAATNPILPLFVTSPAATPVAKRASQRLPYTVETLSRWACVLGPMPMNFTSGCFFASVVVKG